MNLQAMHEIICHKSRNQGRHGYMGNMWTAALLLLLLLLVMAQQQQGAGAYLQPFGDLPDRVLHNFPCPQASVPQLVSHLASEPVGICSAQGVEV